MNEIRCAVDPNIICPFLCPVRDATRQIIGQERLLEYKRTRAVGNHPRWNISAQEDLHETRLFLEFLKLRRDQVLGSSGCLHKPITPEQKRR